jgi:hypothetical protein
MKVSVVGYNKLCATIWLLRGLYIALFFTVGIDKFFNILVRWDSFLSPIIINYFNTYSLPLLYATAVIQIIIGLLLVSRWYILGIYVGLILLVFIFLNLLTLNYCLIILAHDVMMILGMITLLVLIQIKKEIITVN